MKITRTTKKKLTDPLRPANLLTQATLGRHVAAAELLDSEAGSAEGGDGMTQLQELLELVPGVLER